MLLICGGICSQLSAQAANAKNMNLNNTDSTAWAALPVFETSIPQNVIAQLKQKNSGNQIYDITAVKAASDSSMGTQQMNYVVRLIKDGSIVTETENNMGNAVGTTSDSQ